jgi:hypothetical protein
MSKEKLFNILYISFFAVVILALITGFYKFKPESMNTQSILFADNIQFTDVYTNSPTPVENFTDTTTTIPQVKPTMTFYAGDKQPVYNKGDVTSKIINLSNSLTPYNAEIDNFNRLNNLDNINIYQPYDDIYGSLTKKIDDVISNIEPDPTIQTSINNEISRLKNNLDNLESQLLKDKILEPEPISAQNIKSLDNGMELAVYHDNNTNLYNIATNNGCLTTSDNGYSVEPCNIGSLKQQFEMKNIFSDVEYANHISPVYESINISKQNQPDINYPFSMMVSANNLDCLTNNHGEITIQPCSISKKQRWIPLQKASGKCATV